MPTTPPGNPLDVSDDADRIVNEEIATQVFGVPDPTGTRKLVEDGWTQAQAFANQAFTNAELLLNQLLTLGNALAFDPISTDLAEIEDTISALTTVATRDFVLSPSLGFSAETTDRDYTSSELTHLIAQLDLWVTGTATGLPPLVEQAIWDRGRAREATAAAKKQQEALRQFAARGFQKPPGALAIELQDAVQEAQNNDVTNSRDVAIKQADLEQSNRRFAFENAAKIQLSLMSYLQDKLRRGLEAANDVMRATVDAFGHQIQAYSANMGYEGAKVGAEASLKRAAADIRIAEGNLRIEASRANIQLLLQKATILMEAVRGAAQVSAQLSAAALSAVNLSGSLHDATSWGVSVSDNRSRNISAGISSSAGLSSSSQFSYTP